MAKNISAGQLKHILHDGGEIALLDVREAGQFGESHLLLATPLPYSRLELDAAALVPRKSTRVVVCDDGALGVAGRAAKRLEMLGYTNVSVLEGGIAGWSAAGYGLFAGVNVPSKAFGELVEHACHTPRVTVQELARMRAAGEDFVVLDGRPWAEYQKMNIPGGICCPNAELPYRLPSIVKNPKTRIVVNCAGRTRSIIGAQTLINFGVPNPVVALENGTQGWVLADFELERGASRKYPDAIDATELPALRASARKLMDRFGIKSASVGEVRAWLQETDRTAYLCDVRTPEEFAAGSIPGSVHAPGGQLVQATDQWVGVRNARVVLIDGGDAVRAPVVASWLKQLGFDASVLEGGVTSELKAAPAVRPILPALEPVAAPRLRQLLDAGECTVFDLGPSMRFRKAHIPGSHWSTRARVVADARNQRGPIVLAADETDVARVAAIDLLEASAKDVRLLDGGFAAWTQAGYNSASSPGDPADAECIDYLFFVHDRHAGNREAMKRYLAWETGLIAQLDAQERAAFRISSPGA
ncbi:MAG TPA: rhodanese-like domain-containing protein [Burkholderiales bacterium]|nr:rhodanese-like domain-containing protein [Burkholderiales bacterium]